MTYREVDEHLEEIAGYGQDWDGQGSEPISGAALVVARRLAARLEQSSARPPSSVVASPDGVILFTWIGPDCYLEIEVGSAGEVGGVVSAFGVTLHSEGYGITLFAER